MHFRPSKRVKSNFSKIRKSPLSIIKTRARQMKLLRNLSSKPNFLLVAFVKSQIMQKRIVGLKTNLCITANFAIKWDT